MVAKVCRRSWNRTFLHPALSNVLHSRFRTEAGSRGESSFFGEGNIHLELKLALYPQVSILFYNVTFQILFAQSIMRVRVSLFRR